MENEREILLKEIEYYRNESNNFDKSSFRWKHKFIQEKRFSEVDFATLEPRILIEAYKSIIISYYKIG